MLCRDVECRVDFAEGGGLKRLCQLMEDSPNIGPRYLACSILNAYARWAGPAPKTRRSCAQSARPAWCPAPSSSGPSDRPLIACPAVKP